jgi:protein-S-isoprenylcysteine O-methyltransferase Ste14
MAIAALALFAAFILLGGVLRALIQRRRIGNIGNRRPLFAPRSLEWWALAATDVGYLTVGLGGPSADLLGMAPLAVLDHPAVRGVGVMLAVLGILAAFTAQLSLGDSWRIGVDEAEQTALVTTGGFRVVRNPIFATTILSFLGIALMVPNPVAIAGAVVTIIGIEVQVRLVEERYLRRVHGTAYTDYASRVGRFIPGLGRLRPNTSTRLRHRLGMVTRAT